MARRVSTLPRPKTRYYVDEPNMMLTIGEYQLITEHLTRMGMIDQYPEAEQRSLRQTHVLFMRNMRAKLQKAKDYYSIKS